MNLFEKQQQHTVCMQAQCIVLKKQCNHSFNVGKQEPSLIDAYIAQRGIRKNCWSNVIRCKTNMLY